MNAKKILKSRGIKLLVLLLTSTVIATASASVYNTLYMEANQISAAVPKVKFVTGADSATAGATIGTNGTYVSFSSMSGWPNSTRVYQDAIGIQNLDTSPRSIELKFDQAGDWSGNTTDISYIYVKVFDTVGGSQQGTPITVGTAGSSTGSLSILASTTWHVQWEIRWKAGTLSTKKVSVKLTLLVTGG
jgi:hypothetical protein